MLKKYYFKLTVAVYIFWLIFLFLKLPHLIWHPGFLLSWFTSKGLIIHKDLMHPHFTLATFFILPFLKISNWNPETGPLVSLVIAFITFIFIYKIGKEYLSKVANLVSLAFFSLLYYHYTTAVQYTMEALSGLLIAISIFLLFRILKSKSVSILYQFVLGFVISASALSDQIAIPTLFIIIVFDVLFVWTKKKKLTKNLLVLMTGLLIPVFIMSTYFFINNAFFDFLKETIFYYFLYAKLANEGSALQQLPWSDILFFYSPLILVPFLLLKKNVKLLVLFFASTVSIPTIIFSVYHPHHYLYVLPLLAILAGFIMDIVVISTSSLLKSLGKIIALILIYYFFASIIPWHFKKIGTNNLKGVDNIVNENDSSYPVAMWVKNNTDENSTIIVAGDGILYFETNRLPSSKYYTVLPWHYKPIEETSNAMKNNLPDYWLISESYLNRLSSKDGWNSPEVTEYIINMLNEKYTKLTTFPDWTIWKKIN